MTEVLTTTQPIRLKGRSFLALVLSPELPVADWLVRLDDLAERSAGFFMQRPVVLDIAGLTIERAELRGLIDALGERDVRIMGIEGAEPGQLGSDMPPLLGGGLPASDFAPNAEGKDGQTKQPAARSKLITEPVRSGQTLMCDGDITIVGAVSSGAEVIAGGSIHVYGAIRGRALAGAGGDTNARIFCRKLEAELVAIAGYYKTSEDLDPGLRGKAVQFRLDDEALMAEAL
ncbi:septum site-determining protein MinC [Oricola sp.]|uniref:septum site-determining protein MinC n=1 Tax=Oricola sp. TaxID=1979950 RepID=UPI003BAB571E